MEDSQTTTNHTCSIYRTQDVTSTCSINIPLSRQSSYVLIPRFRQALPLRDCSVLVPSYWASAEIALMMTRLKSFCFWSLIANSGNFRYACTGRWLLVTVGFVMMHTLAVGNDIDIIAAINWACAITSLSKDYFCGWNRFSCRLIVKYYLNTIEIVDSYWLLNYYFK